MAGIVIGAFAGGFAIGFVIGLFLMAAFALQEKGEYDEQN